MIEHQFNSSQDILNHYNGLSADISDVLIKEVLKTQARINKKINVYALAKRIYDDRDCQNYVRLHSLNAKKICKILFGTTLTGATVGAIASIIFAPAFVPHAMALGGTVGFSAGFGICLKDDLFSKAKEDFTLVEIKINQNIENFRNECTAEQYNLFKSCINNYLEFVNDERIGEVLCSITASIPDIPVFSPHDHQRLRVYEKAAIEQHLDNVDEKITRAILSGANQEVIDRLRSTYCPFRGRPFSKNELVTDIRYIKKVIDLVQEILTRMKVQASDDPMIQKGLQCLVDHYVDHYKKYSKTIVDKLFDDCVALGTPLKLIKEVCTAFEEEYESKKNI